MLEKIKSRLYEWGYDLWLKVGFKLFYIEVLFNTKEWVLYEYMVDEKPKGRKDFVKMDKNYGKGKKSK
tara:strand:+ start:10320 stop:10523 length:204 start_codon:yes stop_codon:yes gene_type:complete